MERTFVPIVVIGIAAAATAAWYSYSNRPNKPAPLSSLKNKDASVKKIARLKLSDFPPLQNDLFLRACRNEKTERVPVWCMRQAGRYLPEFRAVRVVQDFFKVCRTPDLASEVTLQPIRRFKLDAAIIFCDILVIPQAMGMEVIMVPGKGPTFPNPLVTPADLDRLNMTPGVEAELGYLMDAINLTRSRLAGQVPLIGFCGAPWTLMVYMIEGGGSKVYSKAKTWLYKYPEASHRLLSALTDLLINFLVAQYYAGAQALQIFETVGANELPPHLFNEFCLPYLTKIAAAVKATVPDVPLICFARGVPYALEALAQTQFDVLGLDQGVDPAEARRRVGPSKVLQGNLDPCALYGSADVIRREVKTMVGGFGTQGLICNLGHGMQPQHDPESVGHLIAAVRDVSEEMNKTS